MCDNEQSSSDMRFKKVRIENEIASQESNNKNKSMDIQTFFSSLSVDIANGFNYLHGKNILHGDKKPVNFLLCGDLSNGIFQRKITLKIWMNYYLSSLSFLARLEVILIKGNVNMKDIYGTITR